MGRWAGRKKLFGGHAPALCEIFWEQIESFIDGRKHLAQGSIATPMIFNRLEPYASAISEVTGPSGVADVVTFLDAKLYFINRPGGGLQRVLFDGRKKRHGLRWQALVLPGGILALFSGPYEARMNDLRVYSQSRLDLELVPALTKIGRQHLVYTDAGYFYRIGLCPPHHPSSTPASALTDAANDQDSSMRPARATGEWPLRKSACNFAGRARGRAARR